MSDVTSDDDKFFAIARNSAIESIENNIENFLRFLGFTPAISGDIITHRSSPTATNFNIKALGFGEDKAVREF